MANSYWILNKDYHRETDAKKGKSPDRNLGKSSKTQENPGILKNKTTCFHSGVETGGEIP